MLSLESSEIQMKRLIVDIDNTISLTTEGNYDRATAIAPVVEALKQFREQGFTIVLHSSRNMRSYEGNIGLITARTVPILLRWLEENDIPYDEIVVGKPWCGHEGFYVDDRAIRPDEFATSTREEIEAIFTRSKERLAAMMKQD